MLPVDKQTHATGGPEVCESEAIEALMRWFSITCDINSFYDFRNYDFIKISILNCSVTIRYVEKITEN